MVWGIRFLRAALGLWGGVAGMDGGGAGRGEVGGWVGGGAGWGFLLPLLMMMLLFGFWEDD